MAITRGQMKRQLRKGGGIMDVASGAIGGGNYAGIPMGSRTGFGILKKISKTVKKIIPNEVSKVATIAAPFVAPFNPALAATMAGVGSFDQTGSLSKAFKSGALTYGGGQAARFIGGAGFQGNPLNEPLISSPLGTDTGIGRILSDRRQRAIGKQIAEQGQLNREIANIGQIADAGGLDPGTIVDPSAVSQIATSGGSEATKGVFELVKEGRYPEAAVEAGKKALKSVFLDKDGDLDKTALLAAGSFGLTYADAKKLADDAGVDIGTESEYDEATKAEKKEEYASYLTNFFGGKKDGGRIGYANGADYYANMYMKYAQDMINDGNTPMSIEDFVEIIKEAERTKEAQGGRIGYMFGDKVEDKEGILSMSDEDKESVLPMTEEEDMKMAGGITFNKRERAYLYKRLGSSFTSGKDKSMPNLFYILNDPGSYPKDAAILKRIAIMGLGGKKEGGRIGFESGTIPMADSSFKFTELIEDDTDEKEKLINALLENAREKFPEASEEDIFNFVMSKAAPMSSLMVDGKFVKSTDIETPSIKLSRDMGGPRYDFLMGGEVPVRKNKAGIEELDYRQTGGFVPVGVKEKADDVPAMLSKNEFVLTADAVRGIGGGDVEKGAEKLYGVMKQAEKVGRA
jgi:hypothetical protein